MNWMVNGGRLLVALAVSAGVVLSAPEVVPPADAAGVTPVVRSVRIEAAQSFTRLEIDFSAPVHAELFTLHDDYRLVMDMPEVQWDVPGGENLTGSGLVRALRFARNRPGQSRLVFDLDGPITILDQKQQEIRQGAGGSRMVLALAPTEHDEFMRTAGWPSRHLLQAAFKEPSAPPVQEPVRSTLAKVTDFFSGRKPEPAPTKTAIKPVIVIDPGHGGRDPGAVGVTGVFEKDIALPAAQELKDALDKSGDYTVFMTRTTDKFMELRDRVSFARGKKAALFISLHADSNPNPEVRGTSVYTLSERSSDKAAARHARRENAITGLEKDAVTDDVLKILIELAQRDTMNNSVQFAQNFLAALKKNGQRTLSNSHRFGPFYVLTAADVPSVLIEMGFVSSKEDTKLMTSKKWRAKLIANIHTSIDRFFEGKAVAGLGGGGNSSLR